VIGVHAGQLGPCDELVAVGEILDLDHVVVAEEVAPHLHRPLGPVEEAALERFERTRSLLSSCRIDAMWITSWSSTHWQCPRPRAALNHAATWGWPRRSVDAASIGSTG